MLLSINSTIKRKFSYLVTDFPLSFFQFRSFFVSSFRFRDIDIYCTVRVCRCGSPSSLSDFLLVGYVRSHTAVLPWSTVQLLMVLSILRLITKTTTKIIRFRRLSRIFGGPTLTTCNVKVLCIQPYQSVRQSRSYISCPNRRVNYKSLH